MPIQITTPPDQIVEPVSVSEMINYLRQLELFEDNPNNITAKYAVATAYLTQAPTTPSLSTFYLIANNGTPTYKVATKSLTTPPTAPTVGTSYLVGTGATGAWTGLDGRIANYTATGWTYIIPNTLDVVFIIDENNPYQFNGTWNLITTWAYRGGQIALYSTIAGITGWSYIAPQDQDTVIVQDQNVVYQYTNGAWNLYNGPEMLSNSVEMTEIAALITAAREKAEMYTRRGLVQVQRKYATHITSNHVDIIRPPLCYNTDGTPMISHVMSGAAAFDAAIFDSIAVYQFDLGVFQEPLAEVAVANYWLDETFEPTRLYLQNYYYKMKVQIEYTSGWTPDQVPSGIKTAIKMMVAQWYDDRQGAQEMNAGIKAILNPYKIWMLGIPEP